MEVRSKVALLHVLLGNESSARGAARELSGSNGWTEAVRQACEWRVVPQLSARLRTLGEDLPAADSGALKRGFVNSYGRSAFRTAKAIEAIRHLEEAGIRVAAFKGVAAMALLYGTPAERAVNDADLLLDVADLEVALALLERLGFKRRGEGSLKEYIWFVTNSPGFTGNKAVALYGAGDSELDLHWDLGGAGVAPDAILARTLRARLMDAEIPVVAPEDGFLLTVHHAIRENLAIESVFRDLLDAARWCRYLQEHDRLSAAIERIMAAGNLVPALAVTGILREYDAGGAAAAAAATIDGTAAPGQRRSASRLIELFHYQIRHGRLGKDVLYLVHSRPWRQIARGLGGDWAGYRRSQRSMDDVLGEIPPWHRRASRLMKGVPSLRALKLARELARVKYSAG